MNRLGYKPALDGVRGLAITTVVFMHAFGWPREGTLGVELFFVLSGFLITTLLLEEHAASSTISLRAFYRRRAARLVPVLLVMLLVYEIVTRGAHPWVVLAGATYTSNIAGQFAPNKSALSLGPLWSLAQEEQFYLLWPPLLVLILRTRPTLLTRTLATLIAATLLEKTILIATGASAHRMFAPDTNASPILIGCLFGALYVAGRAPRVGRWGLPALAAVIGFVLLGQWTHWVHIESPARPLFSVVAGFLILAAVEGFRPLALTPIRNLGKISYSLYLWHLPVLVAFGAAFQRGGALRTIGALGAALTVATCSFHLVERPLRARWRQSTSKSVPAATRVVVAGQG